MRSEFLSRKAKLVLILGVGLVVSLLSAQFRYVIIEKIEHYTSIEHITDSKDRRSMDALVDIEIIKRNYFGVGYHEYERMFGAIGMLERKDSGSSNGLTKAAAVYGVPYTIFILSMYFLFFFRFIKDWIIRVSAYVMLLMFLYTQAFVFTPICLAMIAALFVYKNEEQAYAFQTQKV